MQFVGKAKRATVPGAEGLETGTDLTKVKLVAANREKWKRSVESWREEAVRKWIRESTKASVKRKVAKERHGYEARRRVVEEEKQDEQE